MVLNRQHPLLRPRLSLKITLPYLLLSLILGLATVYLAARMQASALNDAFSTQLSDAGQRVSDSVVRQEDEHLTAVRAIARLQGMPAALRGNQTERLEELILPYAANEQLARVIIINQHQEVAWAARASSARYELYMPAERIASWPFVAAVLEGRSDSHGDKFAGMGREGDEWFFYTAGPIFDGRDQIGAVLVGTPLQALVKYWRETTLADVTIYRSDGRPLASSLGRDDMPAALSAEEYDTAVSTANSALPRRLSLGSRDYVEIVGPLLIRREIIGAIGVALPTFGAQMRSDQDAFSIVLLFAIGSVAMVLVGMWLSRRFTQPISELARASEAVASGDLTQQLPVRSKDELGDLIRSFNLMVSGLRERERVRDVLGRFVSPTVAELVLRNPLDLSGELRLLTILFTDIRDFTTLSEQQEPAEVVRTLNEYFAIVVQAAERHRGLVNKFAGDSTLVIFGLTDNDATGTASARAAIQAALDIRKGMASLNHRRTALDHQPIQMGIGINTGHAVAGLIGTEQRMEYTVIGDAVNLTARIQALTREIGGDILISDATLRALNAPEQIPVEDLGLWHVKGKQREVHLYRVLDEAIGHER